MDYVYVDKEGRIYAVADYQNGDGIKMKLNDEIKSNFNDYKIINGEVVYDPLPLPPASFEESQTDFNIDVDYRLACLELGIV